MELDWLKNFTEQWRDRLASGRTPHAVMLSGPRGTGKRAAAAWLAATRAGKLSNEAMPTWPISIPEHPDIYWIARQEERQGILIEQIRGLVADLALTSYEGKGKTAIIEPADLMNNAAANSLLKTLEEPSGDALIILVVDRMGRLPATIVSRCQRIDFSAPTEADSLDWLNRQQPGQDWLPSLRAAGGAPLEALRRAERVSFLASLADDLEAVGRRRASPVEVAQRWAKDDVSEILEWLARQVAGAAKDRLAGPARAAGHTIGKTVLERMDTRNLFCYLDIINRLRSRPSGSFNAQTALEGLLIDWAGGLRRLQTRPAGLEAIYRAG